jgi:SSU ribosomal protein S9P
MIEKRYFQGTGRRKTAVARVRLFPGSGEFVVNGKSIREYFGARELYAREIFRPLELTGTTGAYMYWSRCAAAASAGRHRQCATALPARCSMPIPIFAPL